MLIECSQQSVDQDTVFDRLEIGLLEPVCLSAAIERPLPLTGGVMERGKLKKHMYPLPVFLDLHQALFQQLRRFTASIVLLEQPAENGQQLTVPARGSDDWRQQGNAFARSATKLQQTPHTPQRTRMGRFDLQG